MRFATGILRSAIGFVAGLACAAAAPSASAADHGDAPLIGNDQACDIADVYLFLDPADNNKVCLIATFRGFIASGENANFGVFDPNVRYRFFIENTNDAEPDATIDVRFSRKVASADPQIATVTLPNGRSFTAPATVSNVTGPANPFVITNRQGVEFFAGLADDPFFFDIPGFQKFVSSVRAGSPDPTQLNRGRDSFAGYNVNAIAMRMDLDVIKGDGPFVSTYFSAQRRMQAKTKNGQYRLSGKWQQIDRMANPAVNVVLIPFPTKDAYNQGTPKQDAAGRFLPAITESLELFGVDETSTAVLASIALQRGDWLRLDTRIANSGNGGGTNAAAAFPNGRRLGDDVVDTLITVVNNRQPVQHADGEEGDSVSSNDVPLRNTFPYLALPQQPRNKGVVDDNTRN